MKNKTVQITLCLFLHFLIFLGSSGLSYSQEVYTDTVNVVDSNESFFGAYPLVFFLPETSWGFGAAGIYNFYPGNSKNKRPSGLQLGGAYTLNKQILSFLFYQFNLAEDKINISGEVGYYDYFYFYYGIGNQSLVTDEETYFVRYPRFRGTYVQSLKYNFFIGATYSFDNYNIYDIKEEGLLDLNRPTGYDDSTISAIGLLLRYDSRDKIFFPRSGVFGNLELSYNPAFLFASHAYGQWSLDVSAYQSIGKSILVTNLWTGKKFGEVPFQQLFLLGGAKKGRGTIEGRYRDRSILMLQSEYRFPIFWRFKGVLFGSGGKVADRYTDLFTKNWIWNVGAGLRFALDQTNESNIRMDVAYGVDQIGFYLTVDEAF